VSEAGDSIPNRSQTLGLSNQWIAKAGANDGGRDGTQDCAQAFKAQSSRNLVMWGTMPEHGKITALIALWPSTNGSIPDF